jgi:hypothetical protein
MMFVKPLIVTSASDCMLSYQLCQTHIDTLFFLSMYVIAIDGCKNLTDWCFILL